MKTFVIDVAKCVGCYSCQIGCKDEHCGNCWLPYAESQPDIGQFWLKIDQKERGARPHVRVSYVPIMCQHCEDSECIKAAKDGAVYRRDDGLVIIDPVKAKGQKAIADTCPYGAVYWNEELEIPQKCTGCAHLLDGGHATSIPRCVDNCHVDAIVFGEEDELDLEGTEILHPEYGTHPRVRYRNLPKKFVAGTVYDPDAKEVVIGATCVLEGDTGAFEATTDDWGDFWFRQVPDDDWTLTIEADGKKIQLETSTREKDQGLGDIALV